MNIEKINFARTTWANIKLSKLCPGNDLTRLQEVMESTDFEKQMNTIMDIILILKESYDKKMKFENKDFEPEPLDRDDLLMCDESALESLLNKAFETFGADGETSVETETIKKGKNATSPSN